MPAAQSPCAFNGEPPAAESVLRVLIVDDFPIVRRGMRELLADEFPDLVVGEAGDAATALPLALQARWDLALLDITLPDCTGLELLTDLLEHQPGLPVLVVSITSEQRTPAGRCGLAAPVSSAS